MSVPAGLVGNPRARDKTGYVRLQQRVRVTEIIDPDAEQGLINITHRKDTAPHVFPGITVSDNPLLYPKPFRDGITSVLQYELAFCSTEKVGRKTRFASMIKNQSSCVPVWTCFNGLRQKEKFKYMGVVGHGSWSEGSGYSGDEPNVVVHTSGALTIHNTSRKRIEAGQLVMWVLPDIIGRDVETGHPATFFGDQTDSEKFVAKTIPVDNFVERAMAVATGTQDRELKANFPALYAQLQAHSMGNGDATLSLELGVSIMKAAREHTVGRALATVEGGSPLHIQLGKFV